MRLGPGYELAPTILKGIMSVVMGGSQLPLYNVTCMSIKGGGWWGGGGGGGSR